MRLQGQKIFVVPPPAPGRGGRDRIVVRLTPDDGIAGLGPCRAASAGAQAIGAGIEDVPDGGSPVRA